ncbi:MAG TPA: OmpH family outer membrane protein [Pyrinomonadaceae bacterium]|jgi:Skp family chaperone for outer membrane proteins
MRPVRFTIAAFVLAALMIVSTQAQTRPAAGAAQPSTSPATGQPAGPAKIAVIDSGAFGDEKEGITRVVNAVKQLDAQFQPQSTELQNMQTRYNTLVADIQKKAPVQDPKVTQQQQDQADALKVQIQRKAEDARNDYQKRMSDVLDPLRQDVATALQSFAQARGITLLIDMNAFRDPNAPNPILYVANSMDITREFITEYNRTHPASAAATAAPAGPGRPE